MSTESTAHVPIEFDAEAALRLNVVRVNPSAIAEAQRVVGNGDGNYVQGDLTPELEGGGTLRPETVEANSVEDAQVATRGLDHAAKGRPTDNQILHEALDTPPRPIGQWLKGLASHPTQGRRQHTGSGELGQTPVGRQTATLKPAAERKANRELAAITDPVARGLTKSKRDAAEIARLDK